MKTPLSCILQWEEAANKHSEQVDWVCEKVV